MAENEPKYFTRQAAQQKEVDENNPEITSTEKTDDLTMAEVPTLVSTPRNGKEPVTSKENVTMEKIPVEPSLEPLGMGDHLALGYDDTNMGLQGLLLNSRMDSPQVSSPHTTPVSSPKTLQKDTDQVLTDRYTTGPSSHNFGPIGHHPADIQTIQKLEQRLAAYETAKYIENMNVGLGARPKRTKSPVPTVRMDVIKGPVTQQPPPILPSSQMGPSNRQTGRDGKYDENDSPKTRPVDSGNFYRQDPADQKSYRNQQNYRKHESYGRPESYGKSESYGRHESYGRPESYGKHESYGRPESYGKLRKT